MVLFQLVIAFGIGYVYLKYVSEEKTATKIENNMRHVCLTATDYYAKNSKFPPATSWAKALDLEESEAIRDPRDPKTRLMAPAQIYPGYTRVHGPPQPRQIRASPTGLHLAIWVL